MLNLYDNIIFEISQFKYIDICLLCNFPNVVILLHGRRYLKRSHVVRVDPSKLRNNSNGMVRAAPKKLPVTSDRLQIDIIPKQL